MMQEMNTHGLSTPLNIASSTYPTYPNVTMVLPEGYELIGGVNPNNMFLYYEMVQIMVLADLHSFKLALCL
jgi:hypothetical protein